MPGDVTGFLTDVGVKPLAGRFPRLFLILNRPATFGSRVLVTDRYEAEISDTTGAFVFASVVGSDEMIPATTYTLTADWDAGQQLDVISDLFVPSTGGTISDIIAYTTGVRGELMVVTGFGPPPGTMRDVIYVDVSGPSVGIWTPDTTGGS